ncbi:Membrane metallo-endopeptidase-like 1, partial [Stegodyphus mimosarum]
MGSRNSKDKAVDLDLFVSLLNNYSNYDVCLTSECFQIAADISSHLNQKNEPCDNFFRSTCEEFKVKYDSYHRHYVSPFTQVEDAIALQLKDLLEKELKEKEPDFIAMIKGLYNSCMDEKSIENEDSNPLRNVLKYLGGWPILEEEKWDKSSFDWIDTLIKMRNLGYNHNIFMGLSVKVDQRNKSSNILWLDQPSLGIDGKYLIRDANDSTKNAYRALMVKAMYQLKSNDTLFLKPAEDLKKHILHDTLDFESKIANINWFKYIQGLANTEIKEYEYLIIDDLDFVKDLSHLIAQTDKSLIANYMIWRVVQESLPLLSKPWRTLNLRSKQEPEVSEWQPRWKQCLSYLKDTFEVAINSYYVRRYFPEENKQIAREIYDYIYIELLNAIDRSHWMDYETKIIARDKLNLTNEGYFDKALKVRKWSTNNYFSNVRKPNIGQE